jgi:DNA-binding PadR family transcriptional regulator
MEWIVLGLLMMKDMTIYELNSSFNSGLSLIYSASYGNLQYSVKKLLKSGSIGFEEKVENGRNKKIYRINEKGRSLFFKWMVSEVDTAKLETSILSKIYFLGLVEDADKRIAVIDDMIEKAEAEQQSLAIMNDNFSELQIPEEYRLMAFYQLKTLDYGIMAHAAAVDWLKKLRSSEN